MKAVVIGGAGFLGTHLIEHLLDKKIPVLCLDREGCDSSFLEGLGVSVAPCDVMNPETVAPHIEPGDWVYHLPAYLGKAKVTAQEYWALNVESAEAICQLAIEKKAEKFIFPSSMAAMGPVGTPENPMNEQTECRPATLYGRTKLEAENRIAALAEGKIDCIILRPPPFFGPRMNPITSSYILFDKMRSKTLALIGDTKNYFPLCYVKNLAAAMVDLAASEVGQKQAPGVRCYLVSDGEPVTFHSILMILREKIGKNKRIIHVPYAVAIGLARISEFFGKVFRFTPLLTTDIVDGMAKSVYYHDISLALAHGYKPVCSLEEGIEATLRK